METPLSPAMRMLVKAAADQRDCRNGQVDGPSQCGFIDVSAESYQTANQRFLNGPVKILHAVEGLCFYFIL
jgi:hypothetical protein